MSFENRSKVEVTEPYGWYCAVDPVTVRLRDGLMDGGWGTKGCMRVLFW